jgi:hypothetical protein
VCKNLEKVVDNLHVKLSEKDAADNKLEAISAKLKFISSENITTKTDNSEKNIELEKEKKKLKQKEDSCS